LGRDSNWQELEVDDMKVVEAQSDTPVSKESNQLSS